ncbi:MAG TPA: DUF4124 domain-containing protein [Burkholderiales bacterium]|nr:DUF4124 domain-containing protein [Burkholderiales bacterium]
MENAIMRLTLSAALLLALTAFGSIAHADILRCKDTNGKTLFTDSKCPDGMQVVAATPTPQACTTQECDKRRERDLMEAKARARADREELAAMVAARNRREIEDRRIDEARYEAELNAAAMAPPGIDEAAYPIYPVYPIVGYPARCGTHCLNGPRHHHPGAAGVKIGQNNQPGHNPTVMRSAANEPRAISRSPSSGRVVRDR